MTRRGLYTHDVPWAVPHFSALATPRQTPEMAKRDSPTKWVQLAADQCVVDQCVVESAAAASGCPGNGNPAALHKAAKRGSCW